MQYGALVDVYEELESTSGTLEKRAILADAFIDADPADLPRLVTLVRGRVVPAWESTELGVSSSLTMDAIVKATGVSEDRVEEWWREEGDIGDAARQAATDRPQQTLFTQELTVQRVYETLRELATYEGEGSQDRKVDAIAGLLSDAEPREARYLVRTVAGAMRLGVGEGLIRDALADAFLDGSDEAVDAIERAYEVTNDYQVVAERARDGGKAALSELDVELFRPIKPMLAGKAEDVEDALSELGDQEGVVLFEAKYDGVRAKVHRSDDEIRVFTRRLEDVTDQFPDVVSAVEDRVEADEFILEAELVGYDPESGEPLPFQQLSRRIKRKYDVEAVAQEVPVTVHPFDLIYLSGDSLLDEPLRERVDTLETMVRSEPGRIEGPANLLTADAGAAAEFYESTLADGHEGVMAKNLDATYQPGSRIGYQLKVKPTMEPLDVVVPRAKWSEGRKSDYLGRPYLAVRDDDSAGQGFVEVGRMHTGFTDAELEELKDLLEPFVTAVDGREVDLRPEVVLEVAYEEIQSSREYDSWYALRFPRFERIRHDLSPDHVDTLATVERLYDEQ